MKTRTKKILWSLGIGAILAAAATFGLNNFMSLSFHDGISTFLSITFAEFAIFTVILGATIKSFFFD